MRRGGSPSRPSQRERISPAALFVKVIARISFGFTPQATIRCATRYVSTRVLPEPAPAITSSGPSVASTASCWAGFRSARYLSGAAVGTPSMLSAEAEPFPQPEEAREDEHDFDDPVPDPLMVGGCSERRQSRRGRGRPAEKPRPGRQPNGQMVEHVARLARNGRLDDRGVASGDHSQEERRSQPCGLQREPPEAELDPIQRKRGKREPTEDDGGPRPCQEEGDLCRGPSQPHRAEKGEQAGGERELREDEQPERRDDPERSPLSGSDVGPACPR